MLYLKAGDAKKYENLGNVKWTAKLNTRLWTKGSCIIIKIIFKN